MVKMNSIYRHRHCTHPLSKPWLPRAKHLRNTTSVCPASARSRWHACLEQTQGCRPQSQGTTRCSLSWFRQDSGLSMGSTSLFPNYFTLCSSNSALYTPLEYHHIPSFNFWNSTEQQNSQWDGNRLLFHSETCPRPHGMLSHWYVASVNAELSFSFLLNFSYFRSKL